MEQQFDSQISIRLTEDDMLLLKQQAAEQRRSVAWIARESIRKGLQIKN